MDNGWELVGEGERLRGLTVRDPASRQATTVSPVLTAGEVSRRLRKSRRQVYRYVRMGRLRPCARILGQWLFAESEMGRWVTRQVPRRFRRFFWDAPLSTLSTDHHRDFILGRLLEEGDWDALRWLIRTYPPATLRAFLRGRGAQQLSRRAWRFWNAQLGVNDRGPGRAAWRRRGRAWGGVP